jgi:beta-xylosidase
VPLDGTIELSVRVRNTSDRDGTEVVQLYLHDPVASVVRPVQRLVGFRRVDLAAGESVDLAVSVPTDLLNFTGRNGDRIVEPGEVVLGFGRSSADIPITHIVELTGATRTVGFDRKLHALWS